MSKSKSTDDTLSPKPVWMGTERKVWEDHPELYHYTNRNGLEGIINSQTLFATHYAFLNDAEEIVRFKRALKKLLMPKLILDVENWARAGKINIAALERNGGVLALCGDEIDHMIKSAYEAQQQVITPFIFSFCSHANDKDKTRDGLLSQWRGYGKGGYAIVFEAKKIEELIRLEVEVGSYNPLGWGDVIYEGNEEKLKLELGDQVEILSKYILAMIHCRAFNKDYPNAQNAEFYAQAVCAALYKHKGFEEENEVRIYAYRLTDDALKKAAQLGHVSHLPRATVRKNVNGKLYIELFKNFQKKLPIKRVIVGPSKNKEKIAEELRKDPRFNGIEVTVSGIPYVEQAWDTEK